MSVWRCSVCKKVKELSGAHLDGKNSVRSDCWPCAKKQTFLRDGQPSSAAAPQSNPFMKAAASTPQNNPFMKAATPAAAPQSSPFVKTAAPAAKLADPAPSPATNSNVWRCSVCKKVKELSGTHLDGKNSVRSDCWPCAKKQTFLRDGQPSSAAAPQSNPFMKAAASTPQNNPFMKAATPAAGGAAAPQNNPFIKAATAAGAAAPQSSPFVKTAAPATKHADPAPSPATNSNVWRCSVCKKVKELSGTHLDGKNSVRSDCWPCAKKQTFLRDGAPQNNVFLPAVSGPIAPFLSQSPSPFTVQKCSEFNSKGNPFLSSTANANANNPFLSGSKGVPMNKVNPISESPNLAAPTKASLSDFKTAFKGGCSALPSALSVGSTSPIIMEATRGTSPSFTFKAVPSVPDDGVVMPVSSAVANASNDVGANNPSWVCSVCKKVKDLNGPHLASKTSVRSDCWPCAKKQLFVLVVNQKNCMQQQSPAALPMSTHRDVSLTPTSGDANQLKTSVKTISEDDSEKAITRHVWYPPVIPPNEAVTDFYLLAGGDDDDNLDVPEVPLERIRASASARFDAQLLRGYRVRLVEGVPTRCVWSNRVLYVIAEEPPIHLQESLGSVPIAPRTDADNSAFFRAYEMMGHYAALFLAVEQKLAGSRYRRMRRLFCGSEFSFAASCCYVTHCARGGCGSPEPSTSPLQSVHSDKNLGAPSYTHSRAGFKVYGPRGDPTRAPTLWGSIVSQCCPMHMEACVVSGEQRVLAAQTLYRRTSWLADPVRLTGAAIQLSTEQHAEDINDDDDWADVVLFPGTMKLEDLPAAAALSLPVVPF